MLYTFIAPLLPTVTPVECSCYLYAVYFPNLHVNHKSFCHTLVLIVLPFVLPQFSLLTSSNRYLFLLLPLFLSLCPLFFRLIILCISLSFLPFFISFSSLHLLLFLPSHFIYFPFHLSPFARPTSHRADSPRRRHCAGWHWRTWRDSGRHLRRASVTQSTTRLLAISDWWCALSSFIHIAAKLFLNTATCPSLNYLTQERQAEVSLCQRTTQNRHNVNPLNPELNPICYLLALLAHHFLHVSRIRVKLLTFRLLMSYIYGAPILNVSRSHTTTQHSR